jgi:hypothetical protein
MYGCGSRWLHTTAGALRAQLSRLSTCSVAVQALGDQQRLRSSDQRRCGPTVSCTGDSGTCTCLTPKAVSGEWICFALVYRDSVTCSVAHRAFSFVCYAAFSLACLLFSLLACLVARAIVCLNLGLVDDDDHWRRAFVSTLCARIIDPERPLFQRWKIVVSFDGIVLLMIALSSIQLGVEGPPQRAGATNTALENVLQVQPSEPALAVSIWLYWLPMQMLQLSIFRRPFCVHVGLQLGGTRGNYH